MFLDKLSKLTRLSKRDLTKSSTSADAKENKYTSEEAGKMIEEERSETGRVRRIFLSSFWFDFNIYI